MCLQKVVNVVDGLLKIWIKGWCFVVASGVVTQTNKICFNHLGTHSILTRLMFLPSLQLPQVVFLAPLSGPRNLLSPPPESIECCQAQVSFIEVLNAP